MLTRHVQRATWILGAVFAALLFFLGGAALRLLMGPISLGPFAGMIEDSLNRSVSGVVIRFDQAVLEWSRADGKVNLIVLGTKVFDLQGHIIAQAPKADIDFDAAAMVAGHLSLKRFALIGVQLTGVRSQQGALRLGFGPEQGAPNILETIRDILDDNSSDGGSLESFSIRNARLAFRDEPTGLFVISPDASFTLENKNNHLEASLDAAVEISGAPVHIAAKAALRDDGMPERGTLDVRGLSLPALAANSFSFAGLKPYQLSTDISASFAFAENGDLSSLAFHANGTGNINTGVLKTPVSVDTISVDGRYDGQAGRLALDAVSFEGKHIATKSKGKGKAKATLTLGWKDGGIDTVSGDVDGSEIVLDLPQILSQPVSLSRVSLKGAYDFTQKRANGQRVLVNSGPFSADLTGTADFSGARSPALMVAGTMGALSVRDALKYWPVAAAGGARRWIEANISDGNAGPFRVDANLPAGAMDQDSLPDNALTVSFPLENVTASYIQGMTPLTRARGEARLSGDAFRLTVSSANVGPLPVTNGDVVINDLHTRGTVSRIKAHTEGRMSDVMALVDQEPLGYGKRFGINPATTGGRAEIDLDFGVPLLRDLPIEQLRIGVTAKVTELALPIENRKLEHGMANFAIGSQSLTSQGTATLSGVPLNFKWTEDFAATGISTRVNLAAKLDDATRASLGLSEPKWLTGPMPVTLDLTGRRFHFDDASLKADLTDAVAVFSTVNLEKPAGVPAHASAMLHFGDAGAVAFKDLAIAGDDLNVEGALALDGDGKIVNISLSNVRAGANTDFAMTLEPIAGGGLAVRVQGKSLDASHFFPDEKKKAANAPAPADDEFQNPFSLNATLDKVVFRDERGLRDSTLAVSFGANQKLTAFSLDAAQSGKGKVTGRLTVANGVRNLSIDSDDAGAFINAFTGFTSIHNGALAARVSFPGDGAPPPVIPKSPLPDYQGTITLNNALLTEQPFVARLLAAGSLDGPLRLLQGQGILLGKVEMAFNVRGKTVTIHEGRVTGGALGGTFEGMLDRKQERIDLTGTMVPAYAVNSMLGSVPIIGDILVSKKGEGVFGFTYAMKGNLNEPSLAVNPLSVLTPGIFRRIFEFNTPKEPQPSTEPAPAPKTE
jgi:hypothetical protein